MDLNQEISCLQRIIEEIFTRYQQYSQKYETLTTEKINLKSKCIDHFLEKENEILNFTIFKEIEFFKNLIDQEVTSFLIEEEISILNTDRRIKNDKSIYNKLLKYRMGPQKGKIPIQKCLNDLLGYRFIFKNNSTFDDLFDWLKGIVAEDKELNSKVRVLDSSKDNYKAIHLYFKGISNYTFPCELQVWLNDDDKTNKQSHRLYKQDYLYWEEKETNIVGGNERGE
ncbi:hypothetical protein [Staphylococcus xylosus]